jgi:hypothetical protein
MSAIAIYRQLTRLPSYFKGFKSSGLGYRPNGEKSAFHKSVVGHFELPLWPDSGPSALWLHTEKLGAAFVRRNARSTVARGK